MSVTPKELEAALSVIGAVACLIQEAKEIPSGHLYAQLTGLIPLDRYNSIIDLLKKTKLVEETPGHLLRWLGPGSGSLQEPPDGQ